MSTSPCGTLGTPDMYSLYMRATNLSCGWVHSPQLFCHIRPSRISHIEDGPARADVHFPHRDLFYLDDIGENWTIRDGRVSIIHSSKSSKNTWMIFLDRTIDLSLTFACYARIEFFLLVVNQIRMCTPPLAPLSTVKSLGSQGIPGMYYHCT